MIEMAVLEVQTHLIIFICFPTVLLWWREKSESMVLISAIFNKLVSKIWSGCVCARASERARFVKF